jgi:hypothetical protein
MSDVSRSCPLLGLSCPLFRAALDGLTSGIAPLLLSVHVHNAQTLLRRKAKALRGRREKLVGKGPRETERKSAPRLKFSAASRSAERIRKTGQRLRRSLAGTLQLQTHGRSLLRVSLAHRRHAWPPAGRLRARGWWMLVAPSRILTEWARPGEADRAHYLPITVSGAAGPSAGLRAGSRSGRPGVAASARRGQAGGRPHSPRLLRDLVERDPREGASSRQLDDRSTEPARRHEPRAIEPRIVGLKHTHNREHDFNRRVGLIQSRRKGNVILPRHAVPIPLVHLSHHVTSQTVTEQETIVKYCDSGHSRASVSTFLASCSHRGSSQRSTQSKPDQPTPARDQFKTQPLTANVCLSQTFPRGTT